MSISFIKSPIDSHDKLGFDIIEQITYTKLSMLKDHPFFAHLLQRKAIKVVPAENNLIPTAAVDNNFLYWNPMFMNFIGHDARIFVICHEMYHLIYESLSRMGNRIPELWNCATDYAINATLIRHKLKMPSGSELEKARLESFDTLKAIGYRVIKVDDEGKAVTDEDGKPVFIEDTDEEKEIIAKALDKIAESQGGGPSDIIGLYDERYDGMSAEEIYEYLLQHSEEIVHIGREGEGEGGKPVRGNGRGKKVYRLPDGNISGTLDTHIMEEISEEDREKARQDITAALAEAKSMNRGDFPGDLEHILDELSDTKISWRNVLTAEALSHCPGDYSWEQPDMYMFNQGITMPGIVYEEIIKIALIVDTSGSMSNKALDEVMSEIVGIAQQFSQFEITIQAFDHEIHNTQTYESVDTVPEEIASFKIEGRGGTRFGPSMKWLKEKHREDAFDFVVFFTDGYGEGWYEEMEELYPNFIWLLIDTYDGNVPEPTWGRVIHYDKYQ